MRTLWHLLGRRPARAVGLLELARTRALTAGLPGLGPR
jgi:hypothetical protein